MSKCQWCYKSKKIYWLFNFPVWPNGKIWPIKICIKCKIKLVNSGNFYRKSFIRISTKSP